MAARANALGDFLRARRGQVHPEDVGLIPGARRRVPGLRREELALLAVISSEYYLRLEQGRDTHPSAQILDALARALRLDMKARTHLHRLASPVTGGSDRIASEEVADGLDELIDQLPFPAIVASRYQDVLAANPLAGHCHQGSRRDEIFCAGGFLTPLPANSMLIGTRQPTSQSPAYGNSRASFLMIAACGS